MTKVKDLFKQINNPKLEGLKVRTPKLVVGYIFSLGNCIVFLNNVSGSSTDRGRLFPQIISKNEDLKEWEIVGDNVACNCDVLTQHKYIVND
jgi:hypothetical protein